MTNVIAKVHSVHVMNVEQRQAAADPQTKPPDLGWDRLKAAIVYNHHRRLLLLLSPKADTHLLSHVG